MLSVLIGLVVLSLLLIFVFYVARKKEHRIPDYRGWFIMGIIWVPAGIVLMLLEGLTSMGVMFLLMGAVFAILGLANRDKWGKPPKLSTEKEKKIRQITMAALALLVVLGLAAFIIVESLP